MSELVLFADIEAVLVSYLPAEIGAHAAPAEVRTKVPYPVVGRFVRVERVGGSDLNAVMDSPMVTIQCWDPSEVEAGKLAGLVWAIIRAMPGVVLMVEGQPVSIETVSTTGGPMWFPDPDSAQPRYQFTVMIAASYQSII